MDLHEYLNASSNEQEMYLIKTQLENTKMNVDQLHETVRSNFNEIYLLKQELANYETVINCLITVVIIGIINCIYTMITSKDQMNVKFNAIVSIVYIIIGCVLCHNL